MISKAAKTLALLTLAAGASQAVAQDAPVAPASDRMIAEREALARLAMFDGEWEGEGWSLVDDQRQHRRISLHAGPALQGAVRFMETRSFADDGTLVFHALNNISFDPDRAAYVMQARAEGRFGEFPLTLQRDGYVWQIGGGRWGGLRYSGILRDGRWTEITEVLAENAPPRVISEFTLVRRGGAAWFD